jgi:hypothetical protein
MWAKLITRTSGKSDWLDYFVPKSVPRSMRAERGLHLVKAWAIDVARAESEVIGIRCARSYFLGGIALLPPIGARLGLNGRHRLSSGTLTRKDVLSASMPAPFPYEV